MEKKISENESELLKLSVEMRKKSDEITHLKTREVLLIDKSDTLEKGQIINLIYLHLFDIMIFRSGVFKR